MLENNVKAKSPTLQSDFLKLWMFYFYSIIIQYKSDLHDELTIDKIDLYV